LTEYQIEGIKSNIGFFLEILRDRDFQKGNFDTGFIDRWLRNRTTASTMQDSDRTLAAIAAAAFHSQPAVKATEPERQSESAWKLDGRRRGLRSS
jgi:acetyl/propionyl-CoA carboxylase alpha subunit